MSSARRSVPAPTPGEAAAEDQAERDTAPDEERAGPAEAGENSAGHPVEGAEDAGDAGEVPVGRRGRGAVALLGAVAVAAGTFGVWATVHGHSLRAASAAANGAVVDRSATRSVTRAVTHAVDTIFSYSYADTASTRAAAQHLLTGRAIRQYNELFALVERQAPKEKLVVTTKVTDTGVEVLTGGRARVLVFANQQDTRAGTGQTTYGGAMFAVTAVFTQGIWKIESIDTFTGPA